MATVQTYTRNEVDPYDYPYHTLYASFDDDIYLTHEGWELENYFMETFKRDAFQVNAYVVDIDLVILADDLGKFDKYHLDRVVDFETYIMPNGKTAIEYYQPYIVNINVVMDEMDNHGRDSYITRRWANVIDVIEANVPVEHQNSFIGVRFYDSLGEVITPTAGTVDVEGITTVGGAYEAIGTINATDPTVTLATTVPLEAVRVTPTGVSGNDATDYRLSVWQG